MVVNVQEYLDLIPSQYQNSPKYLAWVERLLTPYIDCQNLAIELYTYFDIDNAIGVQLDILGELIGISRLLPFQPEGYDSLLDDDNYRFLLKSQILKNTWDGKNESLYSVWNILHPEIAIAIRDNQDMTVTVLFIGDLNSLQQQMIEHNMIVPKAQGVEMFYGFSIPPLFAYDQNTDYFKGFDEANWAQYI